MVRCDKGFTRSFYTSTLYFFTLPLGVHSYVQRDALVAELLDQILPTTPSPNHGAPSHSTRKCSCLEVVLQMPWCRWTWHQFMTSLTMRLHASNNSSVTPKSIISLVCLPPLLSWSPRYLPCMGCFRQQRALDSCDIISRLSGSSQRHLLSLRLFHMVRCWYTNDPLSV